MWILCNFCKEYRHISCHFSGLPSMVRLSSKGHVQNWVRRRCLPVKREKSCLRGFFEPNWPRLTLTWLAPARTWMRTSMGVCIVNEVFEFEKVAGFQWITHKRVFASTRLCCRLGLWKYRVDGRSQPKTTFAMLTNTSSPQLKTVSWSQH